MSFVPTPQKATAAGANATQNASSVTNPPAAGEAAESTGEDAFITSRTFDLYWVDKTALMYKDGYVKVGLYFPFIVIQFASLSSFTHL